MLASVVTLSSLTFPERRIFIIINMAVTFLARMR